MPKPKELVDPRPRLITFEGAMDDRLLRLAAARGYKNVSEYIRALVAADALQQTIPTERVRLQAIASKAESEAASLDAQSAELKKEAQQAKASAQALNGVQPLLAAVYQDQEERAIAAIVEVLPDETQAVTIAKRRAQLLTESGWPTSYLPLLSKALAEHRRIKAEQAQEGGMFR